MAFANHFAYCEHLRIAKFMATANLCNLPKDRFALFLQTANMDDETVQSLNHLKAWRSHRRMSQEELAEAVGTTGAVISLLESGHRQLSAKWLRRLAPALGTTPGFLLDHHPDDVPNEMLEVWSAIPESSRLQALQIMKTFRLTGS
jgi:transcriptional regulator with XRE-family HTH domain